MFWWPVRSHRKSAKHSEQRVTGHSAATYKNAPVVTRSGTYKEMSFRSSTETAPSEPQIHTHTQTGRWDLIVAHPPCTYLSNAGAARLYKVVDGQTYINRERFEKGMDAKDFFLKFLNADCPRIAIENPTPSGVYRLPKCSQVIQPFEFGDPYSKRTCLWLRGLPPLFPTEIVEPICSWVSGGSKKKDGTPRKNMGTVIRDSRRKSKTFAGIAKAMADQWG